MSTLLILLPPTPPAASGGQDYEYWFSADAQAPVRASNHGERAPLSSLPHADRVIALMPDAAISWLSVRLPAVKGAKLRSALAGVLEEQLLDDPERMHFAVMDAPVAAADGEETPARWVAAMAREPLRAHLQAFEAAGLLVEALAPLSWPQATPGGYVGLTSDGHPQVRTWTANGVATFPMHSTGIRTWLGETWWADAAVAAHPAAAADAEQWLGRAVQVQTDTDRAWAARQAPLNLLQFELTPRQRGWQRLYRAWQVFQTPDWRFARWGLAGLIVVQLIGINAMAWQQRRAVDGRRAEQEALLRQAFPQTRTIRDAPAQMLRETEIARARAGQVGPGDLEDLLGAVARAWPPGQPPITAVRYESNRLVMTGLPAPVRAQLRDRLGQEPLLRVSEEGESVQLSLRPSR